MNIFISPHLDDIALSCGGTVRRLANQGRRPVIASLCTADAPPGQPLSPAAQHEHWQWQLGDRPYQARCAEDTQVAAMLGALPLHLGLLDAIYRHDDEGRPLYEGKQFMGGQVHPYDWDHNYPDVFKAIERAVRDGAAADSDGSLRVFCPLTVGGHVDHIVARRAVEAVCQPRRIPIRYYEDYPYAAKDPQALKPYLDGAGQWLPTLIALTPEEVETRIAAIALFRSQLFALFGDSAVASMADRVREYVARVGGERYWERTV